MDCRYAGILDDCNANGIDGRSWKTLAQGLWFSPAVRIFLSHRVQYRLKKRGGTWHVARCAGTVFIFTQSQQMGVRYW